MKYPITYPKLYYILIPFLIFSCGKKENASQIQIKKLDNYPSASGIECLDNHLYVIGDDANNILVLDTNFIAKDSIQLYNHPEKRIPKNIKADLEAMAFSKDGALYLFGSGSLTPYRNAGWKYLPVTKTKDSVSLDSLYARIKSTGIKEMNIEGACFIPGFLVLANRGHKAYPKNFLVFTDEKFAERKSNHQIIIAEVGENNDSTSFSGVSGLAYANKTDQLFATVSTEDTRSVLGDGTIGKSYLWIINDISKKIKSTSTNPDRVINLDSLDSRFKGQKIESVCIIAEHADSIDLVLAADNDDGSSTLFKLSLKKD